MKSSQVFRQSLYAYRLALAPSVWEWSANPHHCTKIRSKCVVCSGHETMAKFYSAGEKKIIGLKETFS